MANKNCQACDDLREYAPEFVLNGVTDNVCASLKNNTGFNPSNNRNDCTDLDDANDCLIGNMESEVDAYDVCDWKEFMKKFIPNVWTVKKAIICAICGIWTKIKALQDAMTNWQNLLDALECKINYILGGKSYSFTQDDFIFGTGVTPGGGAGSVPWSLNIKGSTYRLHGTVTFDLSNSHWDSVGKATVGGINTSDGNWVICILKIKKSEYPELDHLYACTGMTTNNACAMIVVNTYDEGEEYAGQWGAESPTHTVPAGYKYVRISLTNAVTWGGNTNQVTCTFNATGMTRTNQSQIKC